MVEIKDPSTPQLEPKTRLPPGPPGKWRSTLRLIRDPRSAMEDWAQRFGDPFFVTALNGPIVVTGRADLIRTIHGQDPSTYAPFATETLIPLLGSGSMLTLDGDLHRRERRMVTPMFKGDCMKSYGPTIQQIALSQLESHSAIGTFETEDLMTDISLETIVRTIFGGDESDLCQQLIATSKRVVSNSNPLLFFSRKTHISFFGLSPLDRGKAGKRALHQLLDQVLARRESSNDKHNDILALFCDATYEDGQPIDRSHIYDELLTFLFAGHETTALSLTWAIYHLHRNPETLEALRQELDSLTDAPDQLASAPYLKAVIQETMRLNPIVTETLRKLKSPLQLGEYYLPAGMSVAPATVLAHYNPQTYPDPEKFRPERFIERSFSPFEYMPFGGGHRRCIGAAFASYEMAIVLGTMLKRFEFELVDSKPVVTKRRSITMGLSSGVPMRLVGKR